MLLDAATPLGVSDPLVLQFERRGTSRIESGLALSGRVVRIVDDPARPAKALVGVAFDQPIPEDELMARVSLSPAGLRGPRGVVR